VAVTLLLSTPVFADGPIFNGNASKLGQIVRAVLLLAAALVAVMGVFFAIKALKNFGNDKEWGNQAMATLGCFALTTVLAVMWALAQGTQVDVGLDF
jgi:Co/Zn/Cd efflux system component